MRLYTLLKCDLSVYAWPQTYFKSKVCVLRHYLLFLASLLSRQAVVEVSLWQSMCSHKVYNKSCTPAVTHNVDGRTCILYECTQQEAEIKQWYNAFFSFCASANLCLKLRLIHPPHQWLTASAQNKALHHPSTSPSTYFSLSFHSPHPLYLSLSPSLLWCAVFEYQGS